MLKTLAVSAILAASPIAMASAYAQENDMTPGETDILEVANEAGNFTTLLDAALAAGLAETLATTQDITVFAPTDDAFAAVENLDAVIADQALLTSVLQLHVVPSVYLSSDIPEGDTELETLGGETITVTNEGGDITITTASGSTASVVTADVEGSNGVVHAIDAVLMP
jgi:uncharacterized surface protein with fasciclin (FAS1) repeats